jgi:hypothetical protein
MSVSAATPVSVQSPPRRRRRWLLFLGFCIALPGVPLALWVYKSRQLDADVDAAIAETDRLDARWRFADVLADRLQIPDEENAALQVQKATRRITRTSFGDFAKDYESLWQEVDPRKPLTAGQLVVLREAMATREEAMAEARTLRDMPRGRQGIVYASDYVSTLLAPLQDVRNLCTLLHCDVMVLAEEREFDAAMHSSHAMLNAGRSIGDEPCLIAFLVRAACVNLTIDAVERVLGQGEAGAAALAELQAAFDQEDAEPTLLAALRGERGGLDQTMQLVAAGKLRPSAVASMGGFRSLTPAGQWLFDVVPAQALVDRAGFLRKMNQLVEAARLPIEQQAAEFQRLNAEERPERRTLSLELGQFAPKAISVQLRVHANLRCAAIALAAERYRVRQGAWPDSLEELVKGGLLPAVPRDPYNGGPLRMKKTADGLVVYSVGPDRMDDNGTVQRRPTGVVPAIGTDQGFQLWNVRQRGKYVASEP